MERKTLKSQRVSFRLVKQPQEPKLVKRNQSKKKPKLSQLSNLLQLNSKPPCLKRWLPEEARKRVETKRVELREVQRHHLKLPQLQRNQRKSLWTRRPERKWIPPKFSLTVTRSKL